MTLILGFIFAVVVLIGADWLCTAIESRKAQKRDYPANHPSRKGTP